MYDMDISELLQNYEIMDDFAETLKSHIKLALPKVPGDLLENLVAHLQTESGVESIDDLKFLSESDVPLNLLKPVQFRKLIAFTTPIVQNDNLTTKNSTPSSPTILTMADNVQQSTSLKKNWVDGFQIDLNIFRKSIKDDILSGGKLDLKRKREVVRALVDKILSVTSRPIKSELLEIARKFYIAYPNAIKDEIDGETMGLGYEGFATQLKTKVENLGRDCKNGIPKVRNHKKSRYVLRDVCANIIRAPSAMEKEQALAAKEELHRLASNPEPNLELVKAALVKTFLLQRECVTQQMEGKLLFDEFPFLFETYGIDEHLQLLMKKSIKECFAQFFAVKAKTVLAYFSTLKSQLYKDVLEIYNRDNNSCQVLVGSTISTLMVHFREDKDIIFPCVEPGTAVVDIENKMPPYPVLVVMGTSLTSATRFVLSVDRAVVNDHVTDLVEGLSSLFALYFMMNIKYPDEVSCTLEFLQRCVAKINPMGNGKRVAGTRGKVLTLANKLATFEWTDSNTEV